MVGLGSLRLNYTRSRLRGVRAPGFFPVPAGLAAQTGGNRLSSGSSEPCLFLPAFPRLFIRLSGGISRPAASAARLWDLAYGPNLGFRAPASGFGRGRAAAQTLRLTCGQILGGREIRLASASARKGFAAKPACWVAQIRLFGGISRPAASAARKGFAAKTGLPRL